MQQTSETTFAQEQEPKQDLTAADRAKADIERIKAESEERAVKKDVISTEPIYRSSTEK